MDEYLAAAASALPRILTQIDRNPRSPTYGCATRAFWHDRTQSFPNGYAQACASALALASEPDGSIAQYSGSAEVAEWAGAALSFWASIQRGDGSFDEAYPGQRSYCATAFSSLGAALALRSFGDGLDARRASTVRVALARSLRWLALRPDPLAANQTCAAAAAMAESSDLLGDPGLLPRARALLDPLLASPGAAEGWLAEYGGADVGYTSVALDALERVARRAPDAAIEGVIGRMLDFVAHFLQADGASGGIVGSRYTTYLLPRPFEALSERFPAARAVAAFLRRSLREGRDVHLTAGFDDRYALYHAAHYLEASRLMHGRRRDESAKALPHGRDHRFSMPRAGMLSWREAGTHLVANLARGGVFRALRDGSAWTDAGFFARAKGDGPWLTSQSDRASFLIEGPFVASEGMFSEIPVLRASPLKLRALHMIAPLLPAQAARSIQRRLRSRAASGESAPIRFRRTITLDAGGLHVEDEIQGKIALHQLLLPDGAESTRFSFASMSFFRPQDLAPKPHGPLDLTEAYRPGKRVRVRRTLPIGAAAANVAILPG